jgi:hypothetical protein
MADDRDDNASGNAAVPARRPYTPPDIAWEEPLEDRPHLVAACAQLPSEGEPCASSPWS